MQQRVVVETFSEYIKAREARVNLLIEFPDNDYQIRKGASQKGSIVFRLVRRFSVNELKAQEIPNARKKYRKQRRRSKVL